MIRLLIADDETWILDRLATTIDWASIGVQVAGTARDGEEALEQCRALRPDIVLTDIRMPCITGLDHPPSEAGEDGLQGHYHLRLRRL